MSDLPPNPKQLFGDKKPDLRLLPLTAQLAQWGAHKDGANKYGPFNWRENPVQANTYVNAAKRHLELFAAGEEYARDTGVSNLGAVMACCAILIDAAEHGTLIDDRYKSKVDADALHNAERIVANLRALQEERNKNMSTIPLAKGYTPDKLEFPVLVSEKLDGVPVSVTIVVRPDGTPRLTSVETRQGETMHSCQSIVFDWYSENLSMFEGFPGKHYVVGELVQTADKRLPFKDTGGIARRQEDQGYTLSLGVFDYFWEGGYVNYADRIGYFAEKQINTDNVWVIPFSTVKSATELDELFARFTETNKELGGNQPEGMVARSYNDIFKPGKRSWGYQKMLNEPTIDLFVVGATEAVDKHKKPKNMVGGLVVSYKGALSKVGAGKMTHKERTSLFADVYRNEASSVNTGLPGSPNEVWYGFPVPMMAQIKYKEDDSYDALRQPTFQCWRDDKTEADA